MEDLSIFVAPLLEVGVGFGVRSYEGRRRNAKHVMGEFLIIHQLVPGHAHNLETDAHEADIINVRSDVGTRSGKTHPRLKGARLGEDAATHMLGNVVTDGKFTA